MWKCRNKCLCPIAFWPPKKNSSPHIRLLLLISFKFLNLCQHSATLLLPEEKQNKHCRNWERTDNAGDTLPHYPWASKGCDPTFPIMQAAVSLSSSPPFTLLFETQLPKLVKHALCLSYSQHSGNCWWHHRCYFLLRALYSSSKALHSMEWVNWLFVLSRWKSTQ